MPEWLIELLSNNPGYTYTIVALVFVLCGLGLPLPEEIVLIFAGYLCHTEYATYPVMLLACAAGILVGDITPFFLGRAFGPRLLRLRWLRLVVNRQRLAMFDRWFRRRGDMVILIARFVPGLRVVAFFTGGTMRMSWIRFLVLDLIGIALVVPTFTFLGWHFGEKIDELFRQVKQVEDSILYLSLAIGGFVGFWYWMRRRARRRILVSGPRETFVEPSEPPSSEAADDIVEIARRADAQEPAPAPEEPPPALDAEPSPEPTEASGEEPDRGK